MFDLVGVPPTATLFFANGDQMILDLDDIASTTPVVTDIHMITAKTATLTTPEGEVPVVTFAGGDTIITHENLNGDNATYVISRGSDGVINAYDMVRLQEIVKYMNFNFEYTSFSSNPGDDYGNSITSNVDYLDHRRWSTNCRSCFSRFNFKDNRVCFCRWK